MAQKSSSKWLWGCLGGCFGLVLAAGGGTAILIWYAVHAIPVVPPETFITPQADGFILVRIDPQDRSAAEMLLRVATHPELQRAARNRQMKELQQELPQAAEGITKLAPLQMVALWRSVQGEEKMHWAAAASTYRYGNVMRFMLRSIRGNVLEEYQDVLIRQPAAGSGAVAARSNNFMWASDQAIVKTWVDRLIKQREGAPGQAGVPSVGPQLQAAYGRLDTTLPFLFVSLNEQGELERMARKLLPPDVLTRAGETGLPVESIASVSAQLAPVGGEEGELTVWVECADKQKTDSLEAGLRPLLQLVPEQIQAPPPEVARESETLLRVDWQIDRLPDRIARLLADLIERAEGPAPAGPTPPSPSQ